MTAHAIDPGGTFGRYEVLSRLGSGGMADVWLARATGMGGFQKKVVLKTMRADVADRPDFLEMFLKEAQIAARLHHPNIVPVFDLGCCEGTYYIAMEYVAGRSLRQIVKRLAAGQRAPAWFVLHVIAAVAAGLQYVHDLEDDDGVPLGLVHCDVSPENLIVSFAGNPTLVDFGIATAATTAGVPDPDALKGKLHYIAPERLRGITLDRRGDIYGLGVVLYEMLAGTRPFRGETRMQLLSRVVAGHAPPLHEVDPAIPMAVARTVAKAMAVTPELRYAEASDLAFDLAEILASGHDNHGERELGLYVSSLFPEATDIPADVQRELRERNGVERTSSAPSSRRIATFRREISPPEDRQSSPAPRGASDANADESPSIEIHLSTCDLLPQRTPPKAPPRPPPTRTKSGVRPIASGARPSLEPPRPSTIVPPARDVFAVASAPRGMATGDIFATLAKRGDATATTHVPVDRAAAAAASRSFERGLHLYRARDYAGALAAWEVAMATDPANAAYRANVQKLRAMLASSASSGGANEKGSGATG